MRGFALSAGGLALVLAGCAAPAPRSTLGPPPPPVLSTRAPRTIPALPPAPPPLPIPPPARGALESAVIVIDAGHGGSDPGALGRGYMPEKVINLGIARELAGLLRQRGGKVVMTRDSDRFVSLDYRAALADRQRADLFVSIHADSARRSSAQGVTIYVARGAAAESRMAAGRIADALQRAGFQVRGVQTAGYRVLVAHSRPAVLIECGFLTNPTEARQLSDPSYHARLAAAIAQGIVDYFSR